MSLVAKPYYLVGKLSSSCDLSFTGLSWCKVCQDETDAETEWSSREGTTVYRKRCKRCGQAIAYGIARQDLTKPYINLEALRWVQESGKDRR